MAVTVRLECHSSTPAPAVRGIGARVARTADGTLELSFMLDGRIDQLRVPGPRLSRMGHELWRHTCFETFVRVDGVAAYHELNFSPSTEWAAYAFRSYRDGGPLDDALAPRLAVHATADRLALEASVALERLSAAYRTATLRLAVTAVVEDAAGRVSYWSLRHPAGKPDFHHADAFALRVEGSGGAC